MFLVTSLPILQYVPYIGWNGYGELHMEFDKLHQFIKHEIAIAKKTINDVDEPTTFVQTYLKEIQRHNNNASLSSTEHEYFT